MNKLFIAVSLLLHIIITRAVIRIIDSPNVLDGIHLILIAIALNAGLYFVFRKIYKVFKQE